MALTLSFSIKTENHNYYNPIFIPFLDINFGI